MIKTIVSKIASIIGKDSKFEKEYITKIRNMGWIEPMITSISTEKDKIKYRKNNEN